MISDDAYSSLTLGGKEAGNTGSGSLHLPYSPESPAQAQPPAQSQPHTNRYANALRMPMPAHTPDLHSINYLNSFK